MKIFFMMVSHQLSAIRNKDPATGENDGNRHKERLTADCRLLIAILMTLFLAIGCQTQKSLPDTLSLEIDTRNGQPLRQALYGFNSNMMSGDYSYLDDDFVALTKALAPKTLRFPGGTVGNFYHWEPGGFFENEMASTLSTKLNRRNESKLR